MTDGLVEEEHYSAEVQRVLKPGGRLLLMEHVGASHGSELRTRQDRWNPLWRLLPLDGCNLNCDTEQLLRRMDGWASVSTESFSDNSGPDLAAPTFMGCAIKV